MRDISLIFQLNAIDPPSDSDMELVVAIDPASEYVRNLHPDAGIREVEVGHLIEFTSPKTGTTKAFGVTGIRHFPYGIKRFESVSDALASHDPGEPHPQEYREVSK